jgi:hypothetical protein
MGKTEFKFEDLGKSSVSEIQRFIEINGLQIPSQSQKKPKKIDLINFIKANLSEKEFNRKFFEFKKQTRISEALKISIERLKVFWGPPLNCEGIIKMQEKNGNVIINVSVKNDKIQHEDCHWIYHRNNFCEHLLAFFLALAKKDEEKTINYLERYSQI